MMTLKTWRNWQITLVGLAMALPLIVAGHGFAQVEQIDRADRETRRIERRVGELEKTQSAFQLDMEKRLTKIETYLSACLWMLGIVATAVAGQVSLSVSSRWRALRAATASKNGGT